MRGGGRRQVANQEMVTCLMECVEQHPTFTLRQLNEELRVRMPASPPISDTTLHRLLRGQLITMKKLEPTPAERNRVDVKLARKAHAEWLLAEDPHLIYIDESGFRRCPNFTLILAVSSQRGRVHHFIHNGGTTADVFNAFLSELLQRVQPN